MIEGKLQADFSSFYEAVDKSAVKFRSFEDDAAKVEKRLSTMTEGFSGRRVIQEATLMAEAIERGGGVTRLTASELQRVGAQAAEAAEKMRLLGMEVPAGIQQIAIASRDAAKETSVLDSSFARLTSSFAAASMIDRGVTALISWGTEALQSAGRAGDLADKTGLSARAIQEMAFIAEQTGGAFESFTNSALQLGVKLAGGSGSVRQAVEDLGLEFNELRSLSPDDQFDAAIASLSEMENVQERNRLALALFGKTGADILPALAANYGELRKQATVLSDETVSAVDRMGDAWSKATGFLGALTAESLAFLVEPWLNAATAIGLMDPALIAAEKAARALAATQGDGTQTLVDYTQRVVDAEAAIAAMSEGERQQVEDAKRLGATIEEITDQFNLSAEAQEVLTEQIQAKAKADSDAAAATKRHDDALKELSFAGEGWRATLSAMSSSVVDAISGYLKAGVSQGALAEAYGLTAQQVKAVDLSIKETTESLKQAERIEATLAKLKAENYAIEVSMSGTTREARLADIEAEFRAEIAALTKRKELNAETQAEATRQRDLKKQAEMADFAFINQHSRTALEQRAEFERATLEEMTRRHGEFAAGAIAAQREKWLAAQDDVRNWRAVQEEAFIQAGDAVETLEGKWDAGFAAMGESVAATTERARQLKKAVEEVFTIDIQTLSGNALQGVINQYRNPGETNDADALNRAIAEIQKFLQFAKPTDNASFFNIQEQRRLLAQLMALKGTGVIPGFASGVENFPGGLAYVHKDEVLVNMPNGTSVIPAGKAGGGGGIIVQHLVINASSRQDGARAGKAFVDYLRNSGQLLSSVRA